MFGNPSELNYRAMRDMGLAAWFGGSLMSLAGIADGAKAMNTPRAGHEAMAAAAKASTLMSAGAISAYILGTQMVRESGSIMQEGVPTIMRTGPESPVRAAAVGTAIGAAIVSRALRVRIGRAYEKKPLNAEGYPEGTKGLRDGMRICQLLVPALTAWLLFEHLKRDMIET